MNLESFDFSSNEDITNNDEGIIRLGIRAGHDDDDVMVNGRRSRVSLPSVLCKTHTCRSCPSNMRLLNWDTARMYRSLMSHQSTFFDCSW